MNTATVSQLPLDFPRFPDVESPTLLRVVPSVELAPVEATAHRRGSGSFYIRGLPKGLPTAPVPGRGGPRAARLSALPVGWRAHRSGHGHDGGTGGRRGGRADRPRGPAGRHPLVDRRVDQSGRSGPTGHGRPIGRCGGRIGPPAGPANRPTRRLVPVARKRGTGRRGSRPRSGRDPVPIGWPRRAAARPTGCGPPRRHRRRASARR